MFRAALLFVAGLRSRIDPEGAQAIAIQLLVVKREQHPVIDQ